MEGLNVSCPVVRVSFLREIPMYVHTYIYLNFELGKQCYKYNTDYTVRSYDSVNRSNQVT